MDKWLNVCMRPKILSLSQDMKPEQYETVSTAPNKTIIMNIQFEGDTEVEFLKNKLSRPQRKKYSLVKLRIIFPSRSII